MAAACTVIAPEPQPAAQDQTVTTVPMDGLARLLSTLPIGPSQMKEVADAVGSSSTNGYDEEYTMKQLFESPGAGVGDKEESKASAYDTPLRDLIEQAVRRETKAEGFVSGDPEDYLRDLSSSDLQIYWPYADDWDGSAAPVITYDPGDDSEANMGYIIGGGEIVVDEKVARERPVWVINRNSDAGYTSLELLRREDPSWGSGGGDIVVRPRGTSSAQDIRSLVIKTLRVERQYDSWFAGGAEFFFKCGSVENFTASTEAELKLYKPSVTDFMIVVQRSQIGQEIPLNALLVSEWTKGLTSIGFMIVEDDGGSQTSWKCSAVVKYNSKSYGFEVDLPLRSRDDIVWRGQMTRSYVEKYSGKTVSFGEMSLVLDLS